MTNEQILALQKEYPKATCMRCTNLDLSCSSACCKKNLDPRKCGRNFNPNGGTKVGVC